MHCISQYILITLQIHYNDMFKIEHELQEEYTLEANMLKKAIEYIWKVEIDDLDCKRFVFELNQAQFNSYVAMFGISFRTKVTKI